VLTVITGSRKEATGTFFERLTLGYTRLQLQDARWLIAPDSGMLASIVINALAAESEAGRAPHSAPPHSRTSS
jgi:hypothetical protein